MDDLYHESKSTDSQTATVLIQSSLLQNKKNKKCVYTITNLC